jgi:hypothetical protein
MRRNENKNLFGQPERKADHSKDISVSGRIILKQMLRKEWGSVD